MFFNIKNVSCVSISLSSYQTLLFVSDAFCPTFHRISLLAPSIRATHYCVVYDVDPIFGRKFCKISNTCCYYMHNDVCSEFKYLTTVY